MLWFVSLPSFPCPRSQWSASSSSLWSPLSKLCRQDLLGPVSLQGAGRAGIGTGHPAAPTVPNLGQRVLGSGAGWPEFLSHPGLRRDGCHLEVNAGGGCLAADCLAGLVSAASLLWSCPLCCSPWPTFLGCRLTPFLCGALGHVAGTFAVQGIFVCMPTASQWQCPGAGCTDGWPRNGTQAVEGPAVGNRA